MPPKAPLDKARPSVGHKPDCCGVSTHTHVWRRKLAGRTVDISAEAHELGASLAERRQERHCSGELKRGVSAHDDVCVCARALSNQRKKRRNFARPLWSLLNTQTRSKRIDADKRPENCFHVSSVRRKGTGRVPTWATARRRCSRGRGLRIKRWAGCTRAL